MANENVVSADLNGGWSCVTTPLWQWDYGQVLEITGIDDLPSSFVAHCANRWEGSSQTVLGSNGRISLPNDLLTSGEPVYVWIVLTADGTDGETKYKITIPVNRRAAPTDYPTTAQQSAITQAINALNTAAASAAAEVAENLVDDTLSVTGKAADAAKVGSELSNLKSDISDLSASADYVKQTLQYEKSIAVGTGTGILPENISTESSFCCLCVPCADGDQFTISGRGGNNTRLWAFGDSTGNALALSDRMLSADKLVVTAPQGSAYFAYNSYENHSPSVYKGVQIKTKINELKSVDAELTENLGFWHYKATIPANTAHPAVAGEIPVSIKQGEKFAIAFKMNGAWHPQIYAFYADGTKQRIYINISATYHSYSFSLEAQKDITSFGVLLTSTADVKTYEQFVVTENGVGTFFNYTHGSQYYIQTPNGNLCFTQGRARSLAQSIAVFSNQVWEFAEGKACYNGIEYSLANGHGNNCNWGVALHGDYPYLYCPTWLSDEMNINVFSFDGTGFTLENTIHINGFTGHLNAYVDEFAGLIYGFVYSLNTSGELTFIVADLNGTVINSRALPFRIPVIQGICMRDGILYVVSGYGNSNYPNYINKISTDGTLLARYPIYGLGEIEGVDFLDNKMILASYGNFYYNPILVPGTIYYGYTKQLEP